MTQKTRQDQDQMNAKEYILRDPATGKWWTGQPPEHEDGEWSESIHAGAGFENEAVAHTVAALLAHKAQMPIQVCLPQWTPGPTYRTSTWDVNPVLVIEP